MLHHKSVRNSAILLTGRNEILESGGFPKGDRTSKRREGSGFTAGKYVVRKPALTAVSVFSEMTRELHFHLRIYLPAGSVK